MWCWVVFSFFLVVFFWCGYHDVARFSRQRPVRGDSQLQRKISALVIFRFAYFYIELYTLRIRVGKHLLNKYDGHYFYSAQISSFKRAEHSLVVRNPTSDNLGLWVSQGHRRNLNKDLYLDLASCVGSIKMYFSVFWKYVQVAPRLVAPPSSVTVTVVREMTLIPEPGSQNHKVLYALLFLDESMFRR